jgi:magnesium transporter
LNEDENTTPETPVDESRLRQLVSAIRRRAPLDAVVLLEREPDAVIAKVLGRLDPALALRILNAMPEQRSQALVPEITAPVGEQWSLNLRFPEQSVGRLMEPPLGFFSRELSVAETIEQLRPIAHGRQIVYAFAVDDDMRLNGVIAMRDLLFAEPDDRLSDIMIEEAFYFRAQSSVEDAMRAVLLRHYPIYPVCDEDRRLIGLVRGYALFEQQTFELTAQPGRMVGIEKEEHLSTSWVRSFRLRHPWLQLNLLTAFVAGAVVGLFEDTIARVVALAAFLPVLAGQSGNTGCQALAVTLRGMTLKELKPGMERGLMAKEALLGLCNGALVGVTAALGMLAYAHINGSGSPFLLAMVVLFAMLGSCVASGVTGVLVPVVMRRLGADPATASTIFLTTATDVLSMGLLLALATVVII